MVYIFFETKTFKQHPVTLSMIVTLPYEEVHLPMETILEEQMQALKRAGYDTAKFGYTGVRRDNSPTAYAFKLTDLAQKRQDAWGDTSKHIDLDDRVLQEKVGILKPYVELLFGKPFDKPLEVRLVPGAKYLEEINKHAEELYKKLGSPYVPLQNPPAAALHPHGKEILIADKAIFNVETDKGIASRTEQRWPEHWLEYNLFTSLADAAFRQARHEWGEDYVEIFKALPSQWAFGVQMMRATINQRMQEKAYAANPIWAIDGVLDFFSTVCQGKHTIEANTRLLQYRFVRALEKKGKTLAQISMIDMTIGPPMISFVTGTQHPDNPFEREKRALYKNGAR